MGSGVRVGVEWLNVLEPRSGVAVATRRMGASLRARYVGAARFVPSGAAEVAGSFLMNAQAELRVGPRARLAFQVFNLLNRHYEDTAYYYVTRIRDPRTGVLEPEASGDYVTHPGQPRTIRIGVRFLL